jgi:hypothetical protein
VALAIVLVLAARPARPQDSSAHPIARDVSRDTARAALVGDGLVHGAPVRPVSDVMLIPGQVQQLNLHPRLSVTLLFPYRIDHLSGGDLDVVKGDAFRSDLTLIPTAVTTRETNFQVHFIDPAHPPIAFRVRVDTTQPVADLIRYVDPVDRYLRRVRADFEAALLADDERRVSAAATDRLQHLLLVASEPRRVDRTVRDAAPDGSIEARVESVQAIPGEDGQSHLWVRYRVTNRTAAPLTDLVAIANVVQRSRVWLFFQRRRTRELTATRTLRTAPTVPPGGAVQGLLILDQVQLDRHQSLAIEFLAFHERHHLVIDHVLTG